MRCAPAPAGRRRAISWPSPEGSRRTTPGCRDWRNGDPNRRRSSRAIRRRGGTSIAVAHGELARVLEVADTSVIAPTELLVAREALLTIADFVALAATPAILDASKIAIAARLLLYALLALAVVSVGLEVGEAAFAATAPVDALRLALLAATLRCAALGARPPPRRSHRAGPGVHRRRHDVRRAAPAGRRRRLGAWPSGRRHRRRWAWA